jgi:hypothetical protein
MIGVNKTIRVMPKLNTSYFFQINKSAFLKKSNLIGGSTSAIKRILTNGDELRVIMPTILGVDAKSITANWDNHVSNYFYNLTVFVPSEGKNLNIGWNYSYNDNSRKESIAKFASIHKEVRDDKTLATCVEKNVKEEEKYLYGIPQNVEEYIIYRYCLLYGDVHDTVNPTTQDLNKSSKIRFYLFDESQLDKSKRDRLDVINKATKLYNKFLSSKDDIENVLAIMTPAVDYSNKDEKDKGLAFYDIFQKNPDEFIAVCEDDNMQLKAMIEKYIKNGILRRLPNNTVITDGDSPEKIIGNNIDEVITWFSNKVNQSAVTEYSTKYKSIIAE